MNIEVLLYSLAQWRQAGARTLKIVVSDREAGRLLYDLCMLKLDFVIEFKVAPGVKVFVIETEEFNRDIQDGQDKGNEEL